MVAHSTHQSTYLLQPNLQRRVENYALAPSVASNAMVPLYEAVYNSIHALQDRFGPDNWTESGFVNVLKYSHPVHGLSFSISDNGTGLDQSNFESFLTYDSDHKKKRGGKGIGRLAWLKVFELVRIETTFSVADQRSHRTFDFLLNNQAPITNHEVTHEPSREVGTTVYLIGMKPQYAANLPVKAKTIASKLVAHFMSYLSGDHIAQISYSDELESIDIKALVTAGRTSVSKDRFVFHEVEVEISHTLLDRAITEQAVSHRLYYAANGRIVLERDIGLSLGIPTFIERDGRKNVYVGIVSSDILDNAVNTERTSFDLSSQLFEEMNARAIAFAREVLASDVEKLVERQADLLRGVLRKFPRYSYLVGDAEVFVTEKLPRNVNKAEQVYQQLALHDFRESRKIEREVDSISRSPSESLEHEISQRAQDVVAKLTSQEFSALADYTARRKVIIDLLSRRLGYRPDGEMVRYSESAVHSIICPLRVTNRDVTIDQHNL